MRRYLLVTLVFFIVQHTKAQFVNADHASFSPQELIENILFGESECVENVDVFEAVSGNFADGMLSYGYFTAPNSSFPFESGIVLSTGRLNNIEGPNNSLSDDNAPDWGGDQDLREALGIPDSEVLVNATSMSFYFTPKASQLRFRYLFASEEYQENNSNTCLFSDVFAFLIRPVENGQPITPFENIALVPFTETPVKVTTVRPEIPSACEAINEQWFGQFNQGANAATSPTNFNGETKVLVAEANLIPDQVYEVKLVIADEGNARFDSAVFLEAGSFEVGVNLGLDRTGINAVCEGDELLLEINEPAATEINWFFNGNPIPNETNQLLVSENELGEGTYAVEVIIGNGCNTFDEIEIEFQRIENDEIFALVSCGEEDSEIINFNLFDIASQLSEVNPSLAIEGFYTSFDEAENGINPIPTPTQFAPQNNQDEVFVNVVNPGNCEAVFSIILQRNAEIFDGFSLAQCPDPQTNQVRFSASSLTNQIANDVGFFSSNTWFYNSQADALLDNNRIISDNIFINANLLPTTLFARLQDPGECNGIFPIRVESLKVPKLAPTETELTLCKNIAPSLTLDPAVEGNPDQFTYLWSNGSTEPTINVGESGTYAVEITAVTQVGDNEFSCSVVREFNLSVTDVPNIQLQFSGNPAGEQTVRVNVLGEGNFVFSLNTANSYQTSNEFVITQPENILYIRDLNGCGIVIRRFNAVLFPKFFTPNNDGFNDVWRPRGGTLPDANLEEIRIFDRFGKLLTKFDSSGFWDGTYQGKPMPSNDYWYWAKFRDGSILKGNITLIR